MKLQDRLPDSVTVDGRRVKVDLDFRNVLRMAETLRRDDLMPEAREYRALRCVCRRPVKGLMDVLFPLLFLREQDGEEHKHITDFEQDADLIRAAFLQAYGINLWRERLHWFEFTGLLAGLPEGSRYAEILGIRARDIPAPTKYNAEERRWLMEAKARHALKVTEKERERLYERDVSKVFSGLLSMIKDGESNGE